MNIDLQANIHGILECEHPVNILLENIDSALIAVDNLDEYVTSYIDIIRVGARACLYHVPGRNKL